jgi:hypothetical protein
LIPKLLQFDGNDINGALLKDPVMKLDIQADKLSSNHFGIYNDTYRPGDTNKKTQCYYLCDPNGKECVRSPPVGKAWYETLSSQMVLNEIQALERATRNKEQKQFPPDVIDLVAKANVLLLQQSDNLENERETKRRRLVDASNSCDTNSGCEFTETISVSNSCDGGNSNAGNDGDEAITSGPRLPPGFNIWWDSLDAHNLFNVNKDRETAVDHVWDLIAKLDGANATVLSYTTIVEGYDADHTMSEKKKASIRMKARYLAQAYRIALDSMPQKNWRDCCKEAINRLAAVHIHYINKNSRVLEKWDIEFRQRKMFCVKSKGKGDLPAFL